MSTSSWAQTAGNGRRQAAVAGLERTSDAITFNPMVEPLEAGNRSSVARNAIERNSSPLPQVTDRGSDSPARARSPSPSTSTKAATCKIRKNALDAVSKINNNTNVHEIPEVKSVPNGLDRVHVKLEYYREHSEQLISLFDSIERDFMCVEPTSGIPIVSTSRLRLGGSGQRDALAVKPIAKHRDCTPVEHQRVVKKSARVEQVLTQGRMLDMDRRMQQLQSLQVRHARAEVASRVRPWITIVIISMAASTMHNFLKAFQKMLQAAAHSLDINQPVNRKGNILWAGLAHRVTSLGLRNFKMLKKTHLDTLNRCVLQRRLEDDELRRQCRIWQSWAHNLRICLFVVRVQHPYRRHLAMNKVKNFLHCSWRGFQIRRSVTTFHRKLRFLQRSIRSTILLFDMIRKKILVPHIWGMETMILGQMAGKSDDKIKADVTEHMEACNLEQWTTEAAHVLETRQHIVGGYIPPKQIHRSKSPAMLGDSMAPPRSSRLQERRMSVVHNDVKQFQARVRGSRVSARGAVARGSAAQQDTAGSHHAHAELELQNMEIERQRLTAEQREVIARQMLRDSVDRWWKGHTVYKKALKGSVEQWRNWCHGIAELGEYNRDLWPEHPQILQHPLELLSVNQHVLRHRVMQQLMHSR